MTYFLKSSLENKIPILIIYLSKEGKITKRKVVVRKITGGKMLAYCFLRKQVRSFSLDSVLSAGTVTASHAV